MVVRALSHPRLHGLSQVRRSSLLRTGFWSVADQGLFSSANVLVNIIVARLVAPPQYGAFATALSVFYLLAGFHTAVLNEPMMVYGTGKYREQFPPYLRIVLYGHWGLAIATAVLLGAAAFVLGRMGSADMAQALAGLAISSPSMLLFWLTRRACYVRQQPLWAVVGSAVNLVVSVAGLLFLWEIGYLSSFSGIVLLGIASVVGSLAPLTASLRTPVRAFHERPSVSMVLSDHWSFGSWNVLGMLTYWASGQVLMLLIPLVLGFAASAAVAAVWNLFRPVSLFISSLGLVFLPAFSRWVNEGIGSKELQRRALRLALLFGGAVGLYGLLLTVVAKPLLHLLFAGAYDDHWLLVGLFGLSTAASVATGMFLLALKALGNTRVVPKIWGVSALLVGLGSIPLMQIAGPEGALLASLMSYCVACSMAYARLKRSVVAQRG